MTLGGAAISIRNSTIVKVRVRSDGKIVKIGWTDRHTEHTTSVPHPIPVLKNVAPSYRGINESSEIITTMR
jgi:hypothetical protein